MEDWITFPTPTPAVAPHPSAENSLAIRNWLFIVAGLVFLIVMVGGATRLTESGLSITEWKPVTGVIPPLNEREWTAAFEKYKEIPQFKNMFPDMDLGRFKVIFGWEWGHRLLARLIGVVFAVPLLWFWVKGRIPKELKPKLVGLLALGGLQGGVGWWMVASGLANRDEVAPERLAIHLLLAACIFSAALWIAGGLGPQSEARIVGARGRLRFVSGLLLGVVFLQLCAGALVAGLRAGLVDNTWPLMEGGFAPPASILWSHHPLLLNFVENPFTAQLTHRLIAYALLALAFAHMIDVGLNASGKARRGGVSVFAHVSMQATLGVATLVLVQDEFAGAPHILFALAHQAVGFAVLAVTTLQARRLFAL
jgi:heme a synthase